jgi:uncharacterized protein YceH (UPF0502 family)
MSTDSRPITEQANALIAEIERSIAEGEAKLREMGLDPQKVRAIDQHMNAEQREQAAAALSADLAAVEQEVAEARARLMSTQSSPPGKARPASRFV